MSGCLAQQEQATALYARFNEHSRMRIIHTLGFVQGQNREQNVIRELTHAGFLEAITCSIQNIITRLFESLLPGRPAF